MSQTHDQPNQDWNDLSAKEVEATLQAASDLAYQLAGDIGSQTDRPSFRDSSELAAIEGALDTELKQLEHLVDRTRQELDEAASSAASTPAPAEKASSGVPDFMAEFMTGEPVAAAPVALPAASAGFSGSLDSHGGAAPVHKPGLVGVGTLGQSDGRKKNRSDAPASDPLPTAERKTMTDKLEVPLYKACSGLALVLETLDKPFTRLSPSLRKSLTVTALAAFGACLVLFIASLLFA